MARRKHGIRAMKLIAIKKECYAIAGVASTSKLRQKYVTLCKGQDFRTRKSWEYVLKNLREDGDWLSIKVSDIEKTAARENQRSKSKLQVLTFHAGRVAMDRAAENDD
jgi:hypothetical protein